jgi:hypothetical protein
MTERAYDARAVQYRVGFGFVARIESAKSNDIRLVRKGGFEPPLDCSN